MTETHEPVVRLPSIDLDDLLHPEGAEAARDELASNALELRDAAARAIRAADAIDALLTALDQEERDEEEAPPALALGSIYGRIIGRAVYKDPVPVDGLHVMDDLDGRLVDDFRGQPDPVHDVAVAPRTPVGPLDTLTIDGEEVGAWQDLLDGQAPTAAEARELMLAPDARPLFLGGYPLATIPRLELVIDVDDEQPATDDGHDDESEVAEEDELEPVLEPASSLTSAEPADPDAGATPTGSLDARSSIVGLTEGTLQLLVGIAEHDSWVSLADICRPLGRSVDGARNAVRRLVERDLVAGMGATTARRFRITPAGKEAAAVARDRLNPTRAIERATRRTRGTLAGEVLKRLGWARNGLTLDELSRLTHAEPLDVVAVLVDLIKDGDISKHGTGTSQVFKSEVGGAA